MCLFLCLASVLKRGGGRGWGSSPGNLILGSEYTLTICSHIEYFCLTSVRSQCLFVKIVCLSESVGRVSVKMVSLLELIVCLSQLCVCMVSLFELIVCLLEVNVCLAEADVCLSVVFKSEPYM